MSRSRGRDGVRPRLSHEHDDFRWVSPDDARETVVWPAYRTAIEQLEHALAGYRGTFVIATHDRRLLETIGIKRTIGFGGDEG